MAKRIKKTEEITKKFGDERKKALDDALKNIEKDFGKGAVMRLGERAEQKVQVMSSGSLALDIVLGQAVIQKGVSLRFTGQNLLVRQLSLFMLLLRRKKMAVLPLSLMQNMPLIQPMLLLLVLILMSFCFHNQIQENRVLKLQGN